VAITDVPGSAVLDIVGKIPYSWYIDMFA